MRVPVFLRLSVMWQSQWLPVLSYFSRMQHPPPGARFTVMLDFSVTASSLYAVSSRSVRKLVLAASVVMAAVNFDFLGRNERGMLSVRASSLVAAAMSHCPSLFWRAMMMYSPIIPSRVMLSCQGCFSAERNSSRVGYFL